MSHAQEITIREANGNDAEAIAVVQVAAWKVAYRGMIPDDVIDALTVAERTARWTEILATFPRETLIASLGDEVIGWSGFGKSRDEDRPDGVAEVFGLYVCPDRWRTGAGRLLWEATCRQLKGDGCVAVDVWALEANERARRFYEAVGCVLDSDATKMFEGDGYTVLEVRYSLTL